jgi:uncharacterized protein YqfA (UPF0365 family)
MLTLLAAVALVPLAISLEARQAAKPISIERATGLEVVQVVPQRATLPKAQTAQAGPDAERDH